jgi:hypothetical protein
MRLTTMNKNLRLIATALALSLPWMGCNKSGKLDQTSTFTSPTGPVELKLKWPQGERIVQDTDMKQNMELTMPGQPGPMKQDMTMGQEYGLTVLKATPDGGHEVEMELLSARISSAMGGKTLLDYDSEKKSPAGQANPVAEIFGKIVGSKIRFFLDASNEVARLEGVDELVNRLSSGPEAGALTPLKSMFSGDYFKQTMNQNRFLPPKAVQLNDTWPVHLEVPMGTMGTMVMDYEVTFQSWELRGKRHCARLQFQGTTKSKPNPDSNPAGMFISSLDGTSSGVSWFDPELGLTVDTIMNQDIKMVMNMPMNQGQNPGASGPMQSITNQMNQVMTSKLVSVK